VTAPYLIVSGDFIRTGGMDRANLGLASYLARTGREVHLVSHRADPHMLGEGRVLLHRVPKPYDSYALGEPFLRWTGTIWRARIARRHGCVVTNGGNCRSDDINWVHYVHAADGHRPARTRFKDRLQRALWRRSERRCVGAARVVVTNSRRTARDVVDRLGVPAARVHTVYYGSDMGPRGGAAHARSRIRGALGWPLGRPVVTFVGALGDRRKGFDTLFRAWKRLASYPDWDGLLCVVGAGRELPHWRRAAADEGLAQRIDFLGFRDDVPSILAAADLLVAPSRYEAYGLGVHEALCAGVPSFVSRSAGVAEHYPADLADFLLDDPEDDGDLSDRLRGWRKDMDGYRARVAMVSDVLSRRTWDDMAAQMVAVTGDGAERA
jgi:glycosyltransferase involved in cell wall biosynthesis